MRLSVVVPARNEAANLPSTISAITSTLKAENIPYELIVVNDGSTDRTAQVVMHSSASDPDIVLVQNEGRHGYGMAVRAGLNVVTGEAVAVMMADASDAPEDLVRYYRKLQEGYDCVFGSRFIDGGKVVDYPRHKLVVNRLANFFIRVLFGLRFNDITNAFKCYRTEVVAAMQPLISPHFNLTVEMPLKAIVRGYTFAVIPISWRNRPHRVSSLRIKEMGSRYLFIVLYLWLEKTLSRGDYHRKNLGSDEPLLVKRERA